MRPCVFVGSAGGMDSLRERIPLSRHVFPSDNDGSEGYPRCSKWSIGVRHLLPLSRRRGQFWSRTKQFPG